MASGTPSAYTGDLSTGGAGGGEVHEDGLRDLVVSVETGRLGAEEFDRLLAGAEPAEPGALIPGGP
jgi:hypothetical protein